MILIPPLARRFSTPIVSFFLPCFFPYFSFILPFYFPFSLFLYPFFLFLLHFPPFSLPLFIFFPQMTSADSFFLWGGDFPWKLDTWPNLWKLSISKNVEHIGLDLKPTGPVPHLCLFSTFEPVYVEWGKVSGPYSSWYGNPWCEIECGHHGPANLGVHPQASSGQGQHCHL